MKRHFEVRRPLLVMALVLALPMLLVSANTTSRSMILAFYNPAVDEQSGVGCSTVAAPAPNFSGDNAATTSTTVYPSGGAVTWSSPNYAATAQTYADGTFCNPSTGTCVSTQLNKNLSTLSVDTRGSLYQGAPRFMTLNFNSPCPQCPYGAGPQNIFNGAGITNTPGLLSIFLSTPFTNMAVCSTTACPESEPGTARFWFDDPNGTANLQWRIDWSFVRVLRISTNTWYVVADGCDGSQVATLYKLANNRKTTTISRQGSYLMPFLVSGAQ